MKLLEQQIYKELSTFNEICFGILVGELGWEIILLSGFIKKYKKDFPDKKIYVCTRSDRKELYENSGLDGILTFDIKGDYEKFTPRGNALYIESPDGSHPILVDSARQFKNLRDGIINVYPDIAFFSFEKQEFNAVPSYDLSNLDFTLSPDPSNSDIIKNILNKKENIGKKVVTIFSRNRTDLAHRNWGESNWHSLFRKLKKNSDFIYFISGVSPSYVKPKPAKNMYILEDIQKNYPVATTLGLCIEAIRNSDFTFGPQTAGIFLASILKVPTLYFGKEQDLISKNYNPFNVYHEFIDVEYGHNYSYNISPDVLYDAIVNFKSKHTITDNGTKLVIDENTEYKIPDIHPTISKIKDPKKLKEAIRIFNMTGVRRSIPLELTPIKNSDGE